MSFSKKPEHNDSIPSKLVYDGPISRYSASLHCNKRFFPFFLVQGSTEAYGIPICDVLLMFNVVCHFGTDKSGSCHV